jgi:arylsulfatase A-like enzyme
MPRTSFQLLVALACTAGLLSSAARDAAAADKLPNLLVIQTDEQRPDTMAAYGNTKIHTPNMDRLAKDSFVFERAYVVQPVCTPSRSAMLTGFWPHTTGLTTNNIPLPRDTRCLPELIGGKEYRTAHMGKWHLGDEIFPQHGFQEWVSIEDGYAAYFQHAGDRNARSSYHQFLVKLGYKPQQNNKFSREFAVRLPIEHCKPKFLEQQACEFLQRNRKSPFVLYVSFLEPHMPYFGPLNAEHSPNEVTLPINFNDVLGDDEPSDARRIRDELYTKGFGGQRLRTEADWRQLIARYWGMVTQVDQSVGAILDTLERLGLADNTIVVYTSDHGDMMGSHRLLAKSVMYQEAVHIPWLIRVPGCPGRTIHPSVSHIDFVPTVLDLMGKAIPKELPGQSLVPLLNGKPVAEDHVFFEWPDPLCRAVISPEGWKLCLRPKDKCQLYNLSDDPGECTNLYYTGKHQDVIERLTQKIRQWQQRVHDPAEVLKNTAPAPGAGAK